MKGWLGGVFRVGWGVFSRFEGLVVGCFLGLEDWLGVLLDWINVLVAAPLLPFLF